MAYREQRDYPIHLHGALGRITGKCAVIVHSERYASILKNQLAGVEIVAEHDQFRLYTGFYQGGQVVVAVTGIGPLPTGLMVHELVGLGITSIYKLGSVGALKAEMEVGTIVVPTGAVRLDGTSDNYVQSSYPAIPSQLLTQYLISSLRKKLVKLSPGVILTKNSYYSTLKSSDYNYWADRGVLGVELECAPLFIITRLKEIDSAAVLVVNRSLDTIRRQKSGEFSNWSESISESLGLATKTILDSIQAESKETLL